MSWTEDMKSAAVSAASGGVIGAASSVASGILANRQQKKLLKIQQDFQRSEREASQRWQEDQWRAQTLYNSPVATMNRLREAGLSPDNVYAGNNVSAMMSSDMPSAPSSSAPSVPTPAGTGSFNQFSEQVSNVAKNVAEVRNINADTRKKEEESENIHSVTLLNGQELEFKKDYNPELLREVRTSITNMDKQNATLDQNLNLLNQAIEEKKLTNEQLRIAINMSKDTYYEQVEIVRHNMRKLLNEAGISEVELNFLCRFKQVELELLMSNRDKSQLDYKLAKLHNDMREELERDLGKHKGYIIKQLIDIDYALKSNDAELLKAKLDSFLTYNDSKIMLELLSMLNSASHRASSSWLNMYEYDKGVESIQGIKKKTGGRSHNNLPDYLKR